jgi:hypothetical protein
MAFNKFFKHFLVLILSVTFCFVVGEGKIEIDKLLKKISEEIMGKSLIRKDLLDEKTKNLNPPIRNIFSPRKVRTSEAGLLPGEVEGDLGETGTRPGEKGLDVMPNIRYIGYIESGHRIVALIIFEEEALAVEEGEMISQDVRVGKVTPEEIELIGPDSKKRKYSLEGEEE